MSAPDDRLRYFLMGTLRVFRPRRGGSISRTSGVARRRLAVTSAARRLAEFLFKLVEELLRQVVVGFDASALDLGRRPRRSAALRLRAGGGFARRAGRAPRGPARGAPGASPGRESRRSAVSPRATLC